MDQCQAEEYLLSRELFGMRFGLDRMRRLLAALGHPERRFRSVHIVGTNGKSSTTRMTAAILEAHGIRTGTYLSPHLVHFAERIRVGDADITGSDFGAAITRVARAAEKVERWLEPGDKVTQFELLTAAAYDELARQGVEVGVIEAGLGGRYDATNVIDSDVQVLTGVGLEHTRWLGPTVTAIAGEKLDVVRPGGTLVLGPDVDEEALAVALQVTRERGATIVRAGEDPGEVVLGALGGFQRRNFAVARAAAGALLARAYNRELDPVHTASAARTVRVPGRLQIIGEAPLTVLDGAHNPDGIAALAESIPDLRRLPTSAGAPAGAPSAELPQAPQTPRSPVVAVISILDDKDAAGMLAKLIPATDVLILTSTQNPRALLPPTLESLARQQAAHHVEIVRDPAAALARARDLAGADGLVLATGSIYLVADLVAAIASAPGTLRRASRL